MEGPARRVQGPGLCHVGDVPQPCVVIISSRFTLEQDSENKTPVKVRRRTCGKQCHKSRLNGQFQGKRSVVESVNVAMKNTVLDPFRVCLRQGGQVRCTPRRAQ